jgi:hypothetical protein
MFWLETQIGVYHRIQIEVCILIEKLDAA